MTSREIKHNLIHHSVASLL